MACLVVNIQIPVELSVADNEFNITSCWALVWQVHRTINHETENLVLTSSLMLL